MDSKEVEKYRYFLKDEVRKKIDFSNTDQNQGIESPLLEKPCSSDAKRVSLPGKLKWQGIKEIDIISAIENRASRRKYKEEALTLEELSFLLWATQGVRKDLGPAVFRNVPSAGNRHAFETYICVIDIAEMESGIYRYLPLEHEIVIERSIDKEVLQQEIVSATLGQFFTARSSVVFIWTVIPYRGEWRYGIAAHKVIAIDAGHVCQNLYLACEAIEAGTCAIAAYDQKLSDRLVGVDGKDEFVIYLASVGKV